MIPDPSKEGQQVRQREASAQRMPLKALVIDASRALARLDTERLQELACCCNALIHGLQTEDLRFHSCLAWEAAQASKEMSVFARVLQGTRANLDVIERLHDARLGRLEYSAAPGERWPRVENGNGNN